MRKILLILFSGVICIYLTGCAGWKVRTSSSQKPRIDQEIIGNRGFIYGRPKSPPKEPTFTERKVYRIEIEIPTFPKKKEAIKKESTKQLPEEDNDPWGNKGYIQSGPKK